MFFEINREYMSRRKIEAMLIQIWHSNAAKWNPDSVSGSGEGRAVYRSVYLIDRFVESLVPLGRTRSDGT
jgi:hypothetical protein